MPVLTHMIDPLSSKTSQQFIHSLVQEEIYSAMMDRHRGYLDIEITGDWGFPDPRRSPAVVVYTWRRPIDAPPPLNGTRRYRIPERRGETTGSFRVETGADVFDAPDTAPSAPRVSRLQAALDRLPPATDSPPDVVTVYLPDSAGTQSETGDDASATVPIRFKHEPHRNVSGGQAWVFEGLVWIDRDFIADTDTHDHLRRWLASELGPRCEGVSVLHARGPFATVRIEVAAPTHRAARVQPAAR